MNKDVIENFGTELIKSYYGKGLYTNEQLDVFVKAGFITADEVKKIRKQITICSNTLRGH